MLPYIPSTCPPVVYSVCGTPLLVYSANLIKEKMSSFCPRASLSPFSSTRGVICLLSPFCAIGFPLKSGVSFCPPSTISSNVWRYSLMITVQVSTISFAGGPESDAAAVSIASACGTRTTTGASLYLEQSRAG